MNTQKNPDDGDGALDEVAAALAGEQAALALAARSFDQRAPQAAPDEAAGVNAGEIEALARISAKRDVGMFALRAEDLVLGNNDDKEGAQR